MMKLNINKKIHEVDVDPDTPLLWVLRDVIGLAESKYGCGVAQCGACVVHLNGKAVRSCVTKVRRAAEQQVVTIEGLSAGWNMGEGHKPPPLSYTEFVTEWDEWINKDGVAPNN